MDKPTESGLLQEDLDKIAAYTQGGVDAENLYTFRVQLCNNDIDRDNERFTVATLQQLAELFKGRTGIFDHSMKAGDQTARIFDAWVEAVPGKKTADGRDFYQLKAHAYMVKTDKNSDLIREIEAGIKKEVSVSCRTEKCICSICGADRFQGPCAHSGGQMYGDKRCYFSLENATDAYEWSFVAVPAQKEAGVTKAYTELPPGGEAVTKEEALRLREKIAALQEEADLAKAFRAEMCGEVLQGLAELLPALTRKGVQAVTERLTTRELQALRNALRARTAQTAAEPQLLPRRDGQKKKPEKFAQFKI